MRDSFLFFFAVLICDSRTGSGSCKAFTKTSGVSSFELHVGKHFTMTFVSFRHSRQEQKFAIFSVFQLLVSLHFDDQIHQDPVRLSFVPLTLFKVYRFH